MRQCYNPGMTAEPKSRRPLYDESRAVNGVIELSAEEAEAEFNAEAWDALGISGDEFRRRWERGEYADEDIEQVWRVASYLGGLAPAR